MKTLTAGKPLNNISRYIFMWVYYSLFSGRSFENTGTYSDTLITVKMALTEWVVEHEYTPKFRILKSIYSD